jgi:hypothetical protein
MRKLFLRTGAAIALGVCSITASCIGPNNAYNGVNNWNSKLSDSKFVNELAYLGLHIVPVYPLALLGDMLIFNSVEFWSGENWIAKPEPFKPQYGAMQ